MLSRSQLPGIGELPARCLTCLIPELCTPTHDSKRPVDSAHQEDNIEGGYSDSSRAALCCTVHAAVQYISADGPLLERQVAGQSAAAFRSRRLLLLHIVFKERGCQIALRLRAESACEPVPVVYARQEQQTSQQRQIPAAQRLHT